MTQEALITDPFDDDKLREECGIFGVIGTREAAAMTALGLHALQHRGQEAGGIVSHDRDHGFNSARRFGYVRDNFTSQKIMETLPGPLAIGHVRYSTAGSKGATAIRDVQPFFGEFSMGGGGADIGPLNRTFKTPLAGLQPDSQRYFDYHHARNDTFEAVNKRELELGAVNMAALIWLVDRYGL